MVNDILFAAILLLSPPTCPAGTATDVVAAEYGFTKTFRHVEGFPFPQLPVEAFCEACQAVAESDVLEIRKALDLIGHVEDNYDSGPSIIGGGWRGTQMLARYREAKKRQTIWMSAWNATWFYRYGIEKSQRPNWEYIEENAARLQGIIGDDAFARGELPLPLSMTR
jgi:Ni,Fe-hydrogenase III large subunit